MFNPDALVANLNMDMPMLFTPTVDLVALGEEHSSLGATARSAAALEGYRLSPDPAPEQVSFIRSDQFSFIRQGIPSIVLGGGQQSREAGVNASELKRDFREKHYHQPSDDLSLPMDFGAAAGLARVYLRMALDVANTPARPAWKPNDFFARKFVPEATSP
jgi:Zn-dependent M28 family amino/carboxypeptidase